MDQDELMRMLVLAAGACLVFSALVYFAGRKLPRHASILILATLASSAMALIALSFHGSNALLQPDELVTRSILTTVCLAALVGAWFLGASRRGPRLRAILLWLPLAIVIVAAVAQFGLGFLALHEWRLAQIEQARRQELENWRDAERRDRPCVVALSRADPRKDALANVKRGENRLYRI